MQTAYDIEDRQSAPVLPMKGNHAWYLKVHKTKGWDLVKVEPTRWEWLPVLQRFYLRPGVNGMTTRGSALAYANDLKRGFQILDDPDVVMRYRRSMKGRRGPAGSTVYWPAWCTPMVAGQDVLPKTDDAQCLAFRRWLVASGTVKLPDPVYLEQRLAGMRQAVGRAERTAGANPYLAHKLDEQLKRLHAARQALANGGAYEEEPGDYPEIGEAPEAPPRVRRRRGGEA